MSCNLFLCNTVYQVLISAWMRYSIFKEDDADIIISNHMNGYETIADNLKKTGLFDQVYTVESLNYARFLVKYKSGIQRILYKLLPTQEIKKYIKLSKRYDCFFFANCDKFSGLLSNVLKRKNSSLKLYLFEDGISTYSGLIKEFYESTKPDESRFKRFAMKYIFRTNYIYNNVSSLYAFNPCLMEWDPDFPILRIPAIDCKDEIFKKYINTVFDYDNLEDSYSEKYIFFEESFYAETGYSADLELVNKLAETVGKENILIKIHPRNPENRFEKLGYKTNTNTFIPWEVIAMNKDVSDKKLITISSTSIINPIMVLGIDVKGYSLVNCLKTLPEIINGNLGRCVVRMYNCFTNNIIICNDIEEITKNNS